MGSLIIAETDAETIQSSPATSLTLGLVEFPGTDSSSRATASFGGTPSFTSKSVYQAVTTATATINSETTIIGVEFDGPVTLTFPDTFTSFNQVSIVDEGGFCNALNPITITSTGALGSLTISSPYAHLEARNNGSVLIAEAKDTLPVVVIPEVFNEPGTTTETSPDGTQTSTSADGNSTLVVNPDGSTELTVVDGNVTSSTTVLADGTEIVGEADNSGNTSSFTTNPDGSTVAQVDSNNGDTSTFTVAVDGTTTDAESSSNGNTSSVIVSPDGTVQTEVAQSNGSSETSVVNPDGSSFSTAVSSNGTVTIISVDTGGVEVESVYKPWQSTYQVTTTPPGTTTTESPNPYQV